MELKYCECCGGLLLRQAGTGATYCSGCARRISELAPPREGKRRGRPPLALKRELEGDGDAVRFAEGEPTLGECATPELSLEAAADVAWAPRKLPGRVECEPAAWRRA
jgi:hypothetical protein